MNEQVERIAHDPAEVNKLLKQFQEQSGKEAAPVQDEPQPDRQVGIKVFVDRPDNKVVVDFGAPVAWLAFGPDDLREFVKVLNDKLTELLS